MTYNEIIKKAGKRITKYVYYIKNGIRTDVNIENIDKVKFTSLSSIIGTAINGCELTLKEPIDGEIYVEVEVRYQQNVASKIYGPYYLKETPEYNADKKNYTHKLYDSMMKSMVEYEPVTITYPCTVYDFFIAVVHKIGFFTEILYLPNGEQIIQSDIYAGINYTYRDVLEDIAIANGILLYTEEKEVKIAYLDNENVAYIDDKILKNKNISFGQHFGPINSIVLSRSADTDKIYYKDDESIAQNGLHEFKISDNQLMNDNNRSDYLPALFNQLKNIQYDIYDTELIGFGDLKPLQKVVFNTGEKTYNSYIFNNEITLTTGYKQDIYNDMPEESETDYTTSDKTDKRINQAYIMIDKQNQNIEALASRVIDVSNTITGIGTIQLENAYEGTLHRLEIVGNISCLFPANDLYPADDLYPLDTYLIVDENEYHLDFTYLNYLSKEVCDKWVYEDGKQWIERKVGVDNQGNLYPLNEPIIEEKEDLIINVSRNSEISLESFENANITAIYLLENEYTDNFTTNLDIIARINLSPGLAEIEANKISLKGKTIDLTSDSIIIKSKYFNVDEDGNLSATSASLSGNLKNYQNNKLAIEIKGTDMNFYDWRGSGSIAGSLSSVAISTVTKKNYTNSGSTFETTEQYSKGLSLYTYNGNSVSLGYKSNSSSNEINNIISFDTNNPTDTPFIINTANGRLFQSDRYDGIEVQNGLIKSWGQTGYSGYIGKNVARALWISNGLIVAVET